jgi:UDP-galactose transporter B1
MRNWFQSLLFQLIQLVPLRSGVAVPRGAILASGVSQMFAMAASNEALRYVSFATQVLGKSCKMVPVMVGGIAAGRKFPVSQYVQVAVITLGVVIFNFGAKKSSGGEDSSYGLSLIGVSLVMDFATSMMQDRVKAATKRANPDKPGAKTSMFESMLWTNASGWGCSSSIQL